MKRIARLVCLLVAAALLVSPAALAQNQAAPGSPASGTPQQNPPNMVEGTVSSMDWGENKLSVGGVAGFLGTELLVNPKTRITGPGKQRLTLVDIRQGDVIRANYRKVGDQNLATSITVLFTQGRKPAAESGGRGAAPQGPPAQGGGGAASQPTGR